MKKKSSDKPAQLVLTEEHAKACRDNIDALYSLQYLMCAHLKQPDELAGDLEQMEIYLRAMTQALLVESSDNASK
jgi:hypothetical protein